MLYNVLGVVYALLCRTLRGFKSNWIWMR